MTRRELRQVQIAVLAVAALVYTGIKSLSFTGPAATTGPKGEFYSVIRVVDGDTLKLSGGERVRLIGVDTPEVHYSHKLLIDSKKTGKDIASIQALGRKASAFTGSLCADKKVRLEYDVEKRDRHGRLLAYVYLADGTFVNAKIIEEGYGQVMTIPPNVKYAGRFLQLQREARDKRKGLWKTENQ